MKKSKDEGLNKGRSCPFFPLINFLRTMPNKWYFWPIVGLSLFVIIYIFYALFAYTTAVPDVCDEVICPAVVTDVEAAYRAMMKQMNNYPAVIFFTSLFLILAIVSIYFIIKKRFSVPLAIIMILIFGIGMRLVYGLTTDAIFERQHDVWHSRGYGHYGIIVSIFHTGELPPVPTHLVDGIETPYIQEAYQLYHPKFFHYAAAYFMRFNRLFFINNTWTLYQSIRILTMWTSVMTLLIGYRYIKKAHFSPFGELIATLFLCFSPIFYRLAGMTNNDNFMVFFLTIAIYNTALFYRKPNFISILGVAFGIGLAMASKLSGGLVALPIAVVFLIVLIKSIREAKMEHNFRPTLKLLTMFLVFATIVFPLGLYWPLYNLKHYQQPFSYVFEVTNRNLMIHDVSFFQRFLFLPLDQFTKSIFVDLSWHNRVGDYNLYATMIKSAVFGEFNSAFRLLGFFLYLLSIAFFLTFFIAMLYIVVNFAINKEFPNRFPFLFFLGNVTLSFLSYLYFNYKYPATCTMDFRYLAGAVLGVAVLFGYAGSLLSNEENLSRKRTVQFLTLLLFGFGSLFSVSYYLALLTV